MSGVIREIFAALFKAEKPMSFGELLRELDVFPDGSLGATLTQKWRSGELIRTGGLRRYSYSLSPEVRSLIEEKGIAAALRPTAKRECSESLAKAERSQPVAISMHALPAATVECDVLDPLALRRLQAMPPSIGTVLPWLDEEEAPPVIGERWRDALRPRPLDD